MKEYCLNCGHGNEYSAQKPTTCAKCKVSMSKVKVQPPVTTRAVFDEPRRIVPEENYASLPPLDVEPFTEEELNSINVANANKSFNMGNLVQGQSFGPPAKKRGRPRKK